MARLVLLRLLYGVNIIPFLIVQKKKIKGKQSLACITYYLISSKGPVEVECMAYI